MKQIVFGLLLIFVSECFSQQVQCGLHEVEGCAPCGEPVTCQNRNPPVDNKACPAICKIQCECEKGYLRDTTTGKCVLAEECPVSEEPPKPTQCGVHERKGCKPCGEPATCQNRNPVVDNKPCLAICKWECQCEKGYLRDTTTGKCVLAEECPVSSEPPKQEQCGAHEIEGCKTCGMPVTCQNRNPPPYTEPCLMICIRECVCENGYIRDAVSGKCVLPEECPAVPQENKCGGAHEVQGCKPCGEPKTCQNKNLPQLIEPMPCPPICDPECVCEKGYIRDAVSGKCVLPEECPAVQQENKCGAHEVQGCKPCGDPETCQNKNLQLAAKPMLACPAICIAECVCENGYIRDAVSGKCVLPEECPAVPKENKCGAHEVLSCKPCGEPETCQNRNLPKVTKPIPCPHICVPECVCEKGYLRDATTGKCVPVDECPTEYAYKTLQCGENEQQGCKPCGNPITCQNRNPIPHHGPCPLICLSECVCKQGYLRDTSTGKCVPEDKCPSTGSVPTFKKLECGENEHDGCKPCGEVATCQNRNPPVDNKPCPMICIHQCECNQGYLRDTNTGKCVLPNECPVPSKEN